MDQTCPNRIKLVQIGSNLFKWFKLVITLYQCSYTFGIVNFGMSIIEISVNVQTFRPITPIDCLIMLRLQNSVCFDFGQYKSEQQRVQKSNEDFQSLNILIVVKMVIFHSGELCNFFCKHFMCAV